MTTFQGQSPVLLHSSQVRKQTFLKLQKLTAIAHFMHPCIELIDCFVLKISRNYLAKRQCLISAIKISFNAHDIILQHNKYPCILPWWSHSEVNSERVWGQKKLLRPSKVSRHCGQTSPSIQPCSLSDNGWPCFVAFQPKQEDEWEIPLSVCS